MAKAENKTTEELLNQHDGLLDQISGPVKIALSIPPVVAGMAAFAGVSAELANAVGSDPKASLFKICAVSLVTTAAALTAAVAVAVTELEIARRIVRSPKNPESTLG